MFDTTPQLDCAGRLLKLDVPRVAGIVDGTPDSFSDEGKHATAKDAIAHGLPRFHEIIAQLDRPAAQV